MMEAVIASVVLVVVLGLPAMFFLILGLAVSKSYWYPDKEE